MFFTLLIIQGLVKLSLLILCLPCLAAVNRNLKMVFFSKQPMFSATDSKRKMVAGRGVGGERKKKGGK